MQFTNYWQQFEHTGRVEDYLNYLRSTEGTDFPNACCSSTSVDWSAEKEEPLAGAECKSPLVDCRAEGRTDLSAGEDGSCRNPCM